MRLAWESEANSGRGRGPFEQRILGDLGRGDGTGLSPNAILLGYEWRAGAVSETWRTRYTETVEA